MNLMNKLKKLYNSNYFEISTIFLITLLMTLKFSVLSGDEVWIYGFSFNIASGMIPYRDFNMVVTPLYPLLQGLFMFCFGKNMITYHIFNAIVCTGIFLGLKKLYSKVYYIIYMLLLGFCLYYSNLFPGYNSFVLFLLLIILNLEDKKNKDFIIGILLGLIFITKQNLGVLLFLPTLTILNIKRISKRILGFIIPIFLLIIYLFLTNSLFEFIDYTILGLSSFKQNIVCDSSIVFFIICFIYCIYEILFKKNKSIVLKYYICFLMMAYPLFDFNHIIFSFSIILAHFLNQFKHNSYCYKMLFYILYVTIIVFQLIFYQNISFSSGNLKYRVTSSDTYNYIEFTSDKFETYLNDSNIDQVYFFSEYAYLFKLHNNKVLNKYDLINQGNMGYNGENKYISEIDNHCFNKKCVFIVDLSKSGQTSNKILEYGKNNYSYVETIADFAIYRNY